LEEFPLPAIYPRKSGSAGLLFPEPVWTADYLRTARASAEPLYPYNLQLTITVFRGEGDGRSQADMLVRPDMRRDISHHRTGSGS
jgi:hypothetical protein